MITKPLFLSKHFGDDIMVDHLNHCFAGSIGTDMNIKKSPSNEIYTCYVKTYSICLNGKNLVEEKEK